MGIGEYKVSNKKDDCLKTFALSSCVAVTAYCPGKGCAGMVHIALPSPTREQDGSSRPFYYASTAIPLFIDKICLVSGCDKSNLEIGIFGGARSINPDDVFNIGEKNISAVKSAIDSLNLKYIHEETGGVYSRTLEMKVETGDIKVSLQSISI